MSRPGQQQTEQPGGVSLVELVILALVLAITAAIVVPQFSRAGQDSRLGLLRRHLATIRAQISRYEQQHDGQLPSAELFARQMTGRTNLAGQSPEPDSDGKRLGPYLQFIPDNPVTGGNTVGSGPVETSDWCYDQHTGNFHANDSAAHLGY